MKYLSVFSIAFAIFFSNFSAALDLYFDPFPDHDNNFGWTGRLYASPEEACERSNFSYYKDDGSEPICARTFTGATEADEYGDKVFGCEITLVTEDGCTGESRSVGATRSGSCPAGEKYVAKMGCTCVYPGSGLTCGNGQQNAGKQCPSDGNPVSYFSGNKFQQATDIAISGESPLKFVRSYNSLFHNDENVKFGRMGKQWWHNYEMRIVQSQNLAFVYRADGKVLVFENDNIGFVGFVDGEGSGLISIGSSSTSSSSSGSVSGYTGEGWVGPPKYSLTQTPVSWTLRHGSTIELYGSRGRIIEINNVQGNVKTTFIHTNPRFTPSPLSVLNRVEDNRGNYLNLFYNSSHNLSRVESSTGQTVDFTYSNKLLTKATYADNTNERYEYDGTSGRLKSITDRKGLRFAEWGYAGGRAIYSQHFNNDGTPVDRYDFDYTHINAAADPRVSVTNPLGKVTTHHYQVVAGVKKTVLVEGHQSANCAAANRAYTWYSNGLLETKTDWKNVVTRFEYNERGLETLRVEAENTALEKSTVTEWHSTLDLPTKIIEGQRVTDYSYESNGNLLSKTVKELPNAQ